MKQELEQLLLSALARLAGGVLPEMPAASAVVVERTRDAQHGDFASNVAMRLAKVARRNPRELATAIVEALPESPLLARTEVAGAGFINFHLAPLAYARELATIHREGAAYGASRLGGGERVLVEFVSANPTGPLHVGHGRQAAYGATLANILSAVGFEVAREYYINDAGRQMDILAVSTWVRYLELCGEKLPFPENGYRGDYVRPLAQQLKDLVAEAVLVDHIAGAEQLVDIAHEPDGGRDVGERGRSRQQGFFDVVEAEHAESGDDLGHGRPEVGHYVCPPAASFRRVS